MMDRRSFLRALGFGAATVAAAPYVSVAQAFVPQSAAAVLPGPLAGCAFISPDWVNREALRVLRNNLTFASSINRCYDAAYVGAQ